MKLLTPRFYVEQMSTTVSGLREVAAAIPTGTLLPLLVVSSIMLFGLGGVKVPEAAAASNDVVQLKRLSVLEAELAAHMQALDEHMAIRSTMTPMEQADFDRYFKTLLAAIKAEISSVSTAD